MTAFKKINLGSGPTGLDSWDNYDWGMLPFLSLHKTLRGMLIKLKILSKDYGIPWPKISLVDIRKRLPLKDGEVESIYCSHVLEHFESWQAQSILKECYRVLHPAGVLRIVLPDIKKMLDKYSQYAKTDPQNAAEKFCRLWYGFDKDKKPATLVQKISRKFIRDHQWHYDFLAIKKSLKTVGFKKINKCNFRKGKLSGLSKLDLDCHRDHSLYVEAQK